MWKATKNAEIGVVLGLGVTQGQKRGMVLLTWPIFVCTTVDLEKFLPPYAAIAEINKIDDGPLFVAPSTVEASAAIH